MSRRRTWVAITVLTITIALSLVQANANLYPLEFGSGFNTNGQVSQANGQVSHADPYPPPTQAQKDEALKIAATSPLCKQYNMYPDESWSCGWHGVETDSQGNIIAPIDGHTVHVFKVLPDGSALTIVVDLNTGKIVSQLDDPSEVVDVNPFSTADYTSLPSTFLSIPSVNTGDMLFNNLLSSPLTDNSEVQPSAASGLSQPFNLFSDSLFGGSPSTSASPSFFNTNSKWTNSDTASSQKSNQQYKDWENAPAPTQQQKDKALEIVSTTDLYKKYMQYPNKGWDYQWEYPYDGHTLRMASQINPNPRAWNMSHTASDLHNPYSDVSGELTFIVDLSNGTILNQNFSDYSSSF